MADLDHLLDLTRVAGNRLREQLFNRDQHIRALEATVRQLRGGGGHTGSAVLDCVCEHAMVPYLKDTRPAWEGLRGDDDWGGELDYEGDEWDEGAWCATLCRVRTTCRAAMRFHNEHGAMDTYLRESKSRHAACRLRDMLNGQRRHLMIYGFGGMVTDSQRLMPQRCIGETWDTVEFLHPGLRNTVDDGGLGEF